MRFYVLLCYNKHLLNCFLDQVQSEDEDEDYRPHWEIHWKVTSIILI